MERIKAIQEYVDSMIMKLSSQEDRKAAYVHLYGVSEFCALLATKRGLDVELASIAGLLHDLYAYASDGIQEHAHGGAIMAKEIMESLGLFSDEDIELVSHAIYLHSDKQQIDTPFDEVLKDGDVLSHCLYNPLIEPKRHEEDRFRKIMEELQ